ncbi:alpha/beta fold hydrolase [Halobacterium wangiae]|uniref:alpha/beta fold hydrolase n=1 Tax=Halobacterium wangiae TaxID=2902623 RepID=UPI001E358EB3|nr:alpha/beta hydrolase [Halobacterium wangiae]
MRLRRLLAGAVGGLALTEAANRALRTRAGPLESPLDGDQGTYRWRGFDVAYTEAGDPEDPDLVCLHGVHAAASPKEFDGIFGALAEDFHVLAPELPGFGRSDRPPVAYTSSLYESFVADFLSDAADDPVILGSSLTGAWATMAANDADARGLLLVCPTAETGPRRPWVRSLVRSPVVGQGLFNGLTSKPSLRYYDEREAFYRPEHITSDVVDYQWQTAHQAGARFAPASFVGGFLDPAVDLADELAAVDCPVTLFWGREATVTPLAEGRELADEADTRLVVLDDTKLLPHEEEPGTFVDVIRSELPQLEGQ